MTSDLYKTTSFLLSAQKTIRWQLFANYLNNLSLRQDEYKFLVFQALARPVLSACCNATRAFTLKLHRKIKLFVHFHYQSLKTCQCDGKNSVNNYSFPLLAALRRLYPRRLIQISINSAQSRMQFSDWLRYALSIRDR